MPRVDQSTINWAVYEDNTEYAGMAQATLPNLTALTQSISGAGIAGNVDAVILGHFDAMSMTLNYRTMTEQAVRLSEPRREPCISSGLLHVFPSSSALPRGNPRKLSISPWQSAPSFAVL